jgi:hypothetical protein
MPAISWHFYMLARFKSGCVSLLKQDKLNRLIFTMAENLVHWAILKLLKWAKKSNQFKQASKKKDGMMHSWNLSKESINFKQSKLD